MNKGYEWICGLVSNAVRSKKCAMILLAAAPSKSLVNLDWILLHNYVEKFRENESRWEKRREWERWREKERVVERGKCQERPKDINFPVHMNRQIIKKKKVSGVFVLLIFTEHCSWWHMSNRSGIEIYIIWHM